MALPNLSERQKTAERLTRELQSLGATVTNVLPLADGQNLRFWIDDYRKKEVLQQLKDAGYDEPIFLGMSPQICTQSYSMRLVNNFELPIAAERQEIPQQDRVIPKDEIGKRSRESEIQKTYDAIYGKQRR
jgi:hypothetical protein